MPQKNSDSKKSPIAIFAIIIILILIVYLIIDYQGGQTGTREVTQGTGTLMDSPLGKFDPEEPVVTEALELDNVSGDIISIKVQREGFDPKSFTVKTGEVVSLVLAGMDGTHGLAFDSAKLKKIKLFVSREEARGISFVAPEPGNYTFFCPVSGHNEKGTMIVQ